RLLPQEPQGYDPLDVMLEPFVPKTLAAPAPHPLPESLLFPARSTEYLLRCYRKRCGPNPGKWLLSLTQTQNCDALTVRLNPTRSEPLQQDYAHSPRESLPNRARWLIRSYHSAPLLVRSLPL